MPNDSSPFRIEYEGKLPDIVVALYFQCPKCDRETRFMASDERPDGSLRCPCGATIGMTEERLSAVQAKFRRDLHSITDPLERLTRRR